MRMNYKTYPTDYVQQLNMHRGLEGRKKSRAFMEYWNDMEHQENNASRFYAKSWDVSRSTASVWINEFNHEIELFFSHWELKNKQHYSYAKNTAEQESNSNRAKKQLINTDNAGFEDNSRAPIEQQPSEVFNNINNNTKSNFLFDKNFNDLFFVYSRNTRFVGKKQEAYEAFARTDVNVDLLKLASMKYLHDNAVDRPVGIKKFLENELYLPYLPTYMRVKSGNEWYEGIYDNKNFEFKDADGRSLGTIEPKLLIELYEKNELVYLKVLDKKAS